MRYKEYKKVDIPWLEEVPSHWEIKNVNSLFDERREKVTDKDYPPLSLTNNGILPQLENVAKSMASDNRKKVLKGDFVINSRSDRKGSSGLSSYDGSVSLISTVIKPRLGFNKFWHYLLKSNDFIEEFYRNGKGIVADLWTTNFQSMKSINLPVPPKEEQEQIARFLDWKINEIDRLIEINKKKITTLDKFLNESIKKTLNNYNRKTTRLKNIAKSNLLSLNGNEEIDTINYLEISDVGTGFLRKSPENIIFRDAPSRARRIVNENNIIISTVRTYLKSIYKIKSSEKDCIVSTGFSVLDIDPKHNIDYIYFVLLSDEFLDNVQRVSYGVSYPAISDSQLMNLRLSIVEDRGKQDEVVEKLFRLQKTVDKDTKNIQFQINNLKLLKQSLISDVVMGNIDVRNVVIPEYDKASEIEDDVILDENFNEEV